jgi:hypothetical protein
VETDLDTNRWIGGGWKSFSILIFFVWMAVDGIKKTELKQI